MFLNAETTGEGPDGHDSVEWAADLPGSVGRVGTYGNSYMGYTSWMSAIARSVVVRNGILVSWLSGV